MAVNVPSELEEGTEIETSTTTSASIAPSPIGGGPSASTVGAP